MKNKIPLGLDVYRKGKCDLLESILSLRESGFRYIVTPNVNHIVQLRSSSELVRSYEDSWLKVCDSRILEIFLKIMHSEVAEVIPGSDLTVDIFRLSNERNLRITVIGAESAQIEVVKNKYPNVDVRHYFPPYGFINSEAEIQKAVDFVVAQKSDFVLFAVGCPQQEILAQKVKLTGDAIGVGLCVGASIAFISGAVKRAPKSMQKLRLEWLYRIRSEPNRMAKRYLRDGVCFLKIILVENWFTTK